MIADDELGNEGYIASTSLDGELIWSIFFTFSNPIIKAETQGMYGEFGINIGFGKVKKF